MLRSGVLLDQVDRLAAVGRADHLHLLVLEQRGQGEDVARVVVDDQHLAAAQHLVASRAAARASPASSGGRSVTTRCRNSAVSSSSRSGDCTSFSTMLLAIALSRACSSAVRSLPVKTTTGTSRQRRLGVHLLEQLEAGHVGQAQVEHDAVERLRRAAPPAPRRRVPTAAISMSSWPSSSTIDVALDVVVLDDQQPLGARRGERP